MEAKVTKEVAEAEFDRFMEAMDLESAPVHKDDEDRESFESAKYELVNSIMHGNLVFEDDVLMLTPKGGGDAIRFPEPDGKTIIAMDQAKKGHDQARMFKLLAQLTKSTEVRFHAMKRRDLRVCEAILQLFLVSRSRPAS